jgi:uncharacterized membrane protein
VPCASAAVTHCLHDLIAVHRLVGEQQQDGCPNVAPLGTSAPTSPTTGSATSTSTFRASVAMRTMLFTPRAWSTTGLITPTTRSAVLKLPYRTLILKSHECLLSLKTVSRYIAIVSIASAALAEIRTLSRGIAPPILAEQGLEAAITALAARGSIRTSVEVEDVQLSDAAQNAAYFVVAEALANMEKHSQARSASIEVRRVGALAVINITDDGIGGASPAKGHGLSGLVDRLAGVDGTLTVSSPSGGPTVLTATIPQA